MGTCREGTDARGLRVLIADDNRDYADSLAILLRLLGHEASVAYNGQTALRMAPALQPHVVLLDLAMPGLNGYEVARQLQALPGFAAVILALTGYADNNHQQRGQGLFQDYLIKPIEFGDLEQRLTRLRDGAALACA